MGFRIDRIGIAVSVGLAGILLITSCTGDTPPSGAANPDQPATQTDPNQTAIINVGGKLFNIPSPLETAFLVKDHGGPFQDQLLNNSDDVAKYATRHQQAINLGVYSADLGFMLIFGQSQNSFSYLNACKKLGGNLGITGADYLDVFSRYEDHVDNRDSLMQMIGELNRASDAYLKDNEAEDISSLILFGGWIESLYYSTQVLKTAQSDDIKRRIGEQKTSLGNLIKLLQPYGQKAEIGEIVVELNELKKMYANVEFAYTFKEATTNAETKTTVINSESEVKISDEQLKAITDKIESIRNRIIG